jgi:acetyl-CoA carboxylase biotin carboxyl carrier protein
VEVKQINQLMIAMGRYGIKKLLFRQDGAEVQLERESRYADRPFGAISEEENPLHSDFARRRCQTMESEGTFATTELPPLSEAKEEDLGVYIDAPMVGTVYLTPSPNEPFFVKKGDTIDENTVVCIVEAMKVMNEVKAGVRGVIADVLIENSHPVEYGTRLFRVVPSQS